VAHASHMIYLNSYMPLISTRAGQIAAANHGIHPFVDGSCRREPDFESDYPSISALCRFRIFAPRLLEGDIAVYLTRKGRYPGYPDSHWRFVAMLQVLHRFRTHRAAADWYLANNVPLPKNCIVPGNPPLPLDHTLGDHHDLQQWDAVYHARALLCGTFLVCQALYRELDNPPVVTVAMMQAVFGRIPGLQNPGSISQDELDNFRNACGA